MRVHSASGDNYVDTIYDGPNGSPDWSLLFRANMDLTTLPEFDFGARFSAILTFASAGGEEIGINAWQASGAGDLQIGAYVSDGTDTYDTFSPFDSVAEATDFRGVIVYDQTAGTLRIWVNGTELTFNNAGPFGGPTTTTNPIDFTSLNAGVRLITGSSSEVGDVGVYHRALTPAEAVAASNLASPTYPDSPVYWRSLQSSGQPELVSGDTAAVTETGGSFASHTPTTVPNIPSVAAVVTVDRTTRLQNWYGMRSTLDAFESDAPIVADGGGNTGLKFDIPDAVFDGMMTQLAQAGLHHIRIDVHAERSQEGGTFGGSGPGGTGYTAGPYVSSGYSVDTDATDAKIDAWLRFRDAVIAEGGTPRLTMQCVFWNDDGIHDDPPGDPGQNAVDFAMSFLDRARTLYGVVPDCVAWVNEADNNFIPSGGAITPLQLARSFRKLVTALDAVAGQPYANTLLSYTEVTGTVDDAGNPVAAYTVAEYLAELQTQDASLLSRVTLGFHAYPDGNRVNGLATIPTALSTYSVAEAIQGEFWQGANAEVQDDIFAQIVTAQASLSEMHSVGAYPKATADAGDYGQLVSSALNAWGTAITDFVEGPREPLTRLWVRYLQWGSERVSESVSGAGSVRATSWFDAQGRTVVLVEETGGAATDVEIAGLGAASDWESVEVDTGSGLSAADPTAIALGANELAAVVFTPVRVALGSSVSDASPASQTPTVAAGAVSLAAPLSTATPTSQAPSVQAGAVVVSAPLTDAQPSSVAPAASATSVQVGAPLTDAAPSSIAPQAQAASASVSAPLTDAQPVSQAPQAAAGVVQVPAPLTSAAPQSIAPMAAPGAVLVSMPLTTAVPTSLTPLPSTIGVVAAPLTDAAPTSLAPSAQAAGAVSVAASLTAAAPQSIAPGVTGSAAIVAAPLTNAAPQSLAPAVAASSGVVAAPLTAAAPISLAPSANAAGAVTAAAPLTTASPQSIAPVVPSVSVVAAPLTLALPASLVPTASLPLALDPITTEVLVSGTLQSFLLKRMDDMTTFRTGQVGWVEALVTAQDIDDPDGPQVPVAFAGVTNQRFLVRINEGFRAYVAAEASDIDDAAGDGSDGRWKALLDEDLLDRKGDYTLLATWIDANGRPMVSGQALSLTVIEGA